LTVEWVEVRARTIDEAKDRALDYLGVDETQAEFEVLEEPKTGLFGRLKSEARVRARVRPAQARPKVERRDRRRRRGREDGSPGDGGSTSGGKSGRSGQSERSGGERSSGRQSRPPREGQTSGADRPTESRTGSDRAARADEVGSERPNEPERTAGQAAATTAARAASEPERSPSGGKGGGPVSAASQPAAADVITTDLPGPDEGFQPVPEEVSDRTNDQTEDPVDDEDGAVTIDDEIEAAEVFLRGLVDAFGLDGAIETVVNDDESRELRVTGADLGLLVGPRGGSIEAVQELPRLAARRDSVGRSELRLRVDVGGYRERRRVALARFARTLAEEVRASGMQKVLEPMSSPDRKIVHDAITDIEGVGTLSEGEDPRRRVVIVPQP